MSFVLLVALVLIIEGLGLKHGHSLAYFLIPTGIAVLFATSNKKLLWPRSATLVFIAFFGLLVLSTVFSLDIPASLRQLLFYFALFLGFIYSYNHQQELEKPTLALIFVSAVMFSVYSLLLQFVLDRQSALSLVANEYNFVFPVFQQHNHLGTFLVLTLLVMPFVFKNRLYFGLVAAFFLLLIALSYSRSANLALFLGSLLLLFNKKSEKMNIALVGVAIIGLFVLIFSFVVKTAPISRLQYLQLAIQAIKEYALFGVGLGNFRIASFKYSPNPFQWVDTSHNIFVDMFAEGGVFTGLIFTILIAIIIIQANKKSLFFPAFLALLINFQTIYTYKIYSFCFLFFAIAGLLYKEKKSIPGNKLLYASPLLLLIAANLLLLVQVLPGLNLQQAIAESVFQAKKDRAFFLLKIYKALYRGRANVYSSAGDIYNFYGQPQQALANYKKAYQLHPYEDITLYRKIYQLEKKLNGEKKAQAFLYTYLKKVAAIPQKWFPSSLVINDAQEFCKTTVCPLKITDLD